MIYRLEKSESESLENFLTFVNGDEYQALAKSYIKCMFSDDFRKPVFLVYIKDGAIIGAAAFSEELFTVNTWGISWVSVHPDFRSRGIGQELVDMCMKEISKHIKQASTVLLLTYPGKTGLYEKCGFKGSTRDHEGGIFLSATICPNLRG